MLSKSIHILLFIFITLFPYSTIIAATSISEITDALNPKTSIVKVESPNKEEKKGISTSLIHIFQQADTIIKITITVLVFFSILSWSIIIERSIYFILTKNKIKKFESFIWSGQQFDKIYNILKKTSNDSNPLSLIFTSAFEEQQITNTNNIKERVYIVMNSKINKITNTLENSINFLAILSNSAPFIGLFGTVWGIMHSFQDIANNNSSNLAVVAPGIAEALLATALGLIVAIPASIFYNKFTANINNIASRSADFRDNIINILLRHNHS